MEVKLITTVVILSILLIITIVKYILYRRQIVNICRQMAFIRENNTNKIIYNDIIEREVLKLTDLVNLMCEEHKAKENILKDEVFKRDKEMIWKCNNCGYHHYGKEAPERCPSCLHKQEHFELFCENY